MVQYFLQVHFHITYKIIRGFMLFIYWWSSIVHSYLVNGADIVLSIVNNNHNDYIQSLILVLSIKSK